MNLESFIKRCWENYRLGSIQDFERNSYRQRYFNAWQRAIRLSMAAVAQTPKPAEPKPPVVPDSVKLEYAKAQLALREAQYNLQEIVGSIQQFCGSDFAPTLDAKGDPACAAKPKTAEKK